MLADASNFFGWNYLAATNASEWRLIELQSTAGRSTMTCGTVAPRHSLGLTDGRTI